MAVLAASEALCAGLSRSSEGRPPSAKRSTPCAPSWSRPFEGVPEGGSEAPRGAGGATPSSTVRSATCPMPQASPRVGRFSGTRGGRSPSSDGARRMEGEFPNWSCFRSLSVLRARGALAGWSDLAHASSASSSQALPLRELEDDGLYWGFAPDPSYRRMPCIHSSR